MSFREVNQDSITQHLVNLFETKEEEMRKRWAVYDQESDGSGKHLKIYSDLQPELTYTPAIEIIEKGSENSIFSVSTQEERFLYNIIMTVTNSHPIESRKYCRMIGHTVFEILNDFQNRAFKLPDTSICVYYSEATRIDYGTRRGRGLISASVDWSCKLLKPNRYGYKM